jgi:hypothetical protein
MSDVNGAAADDITRLCFEVDMWITVSGDDIIEQELDCSLTLRENLVR